MAQLHYELKDALIKGDILKNTLTNIEDACKRAHCYAVVVGGIALERCIEQSWRARRYLRHVVVEDIDIVFAIRAHLTGRSKEAIRRRVSRATKLRNIFMTELQANAEAWLQEKGMGESMRVQLDTSLSNIPVIKWAHITSLVTVDSAGIQRTLVDTKILDQVVAERAKTNIGGIREKTGSKDLVPYVEIDGIKYATCEFVYYDTIRMLITRLEYFQEKNTMFSLLKLYRHIVKFMALYVLRNNIRGLPPSMKKIYTRINRRLRKTDIIGLGIKSDQFTKTYDSRYVENVKNLLVDVVKATNITKLVKHFKLMHASSNKGYSLH
jgi:hypothetical protein